MKRKIIKFIFLIITFVIPVFSDSITNIPTAEILDAMRFQSGYNVTATTNVARFQANVLFHLVQKKIKNNSLQSILFLGYKEWFNAYLEYTGLSKSEAPIFAKLAFENKQNQVIDFKKNHVIDKIIKGKIPNIAMNVIVGWSKPLNTSLKFSFIDTLSIPKLQATNKRIISYRLLKFDDMIVYDKINGLTGQPISGLLGLLFKIIGEGEVVQSRITITTDNLQICYAKVKKGLFHLNSILTLFPDGTTYKNLPKNRMDLEIYEKSLMQPIQIKYFPFEANFISVISNK